MQVATIRRRFMTDERARSYDEAPLFAALTPYSGDLAAMVRSDQRTAVVTPLGIVYVAEQFARFVDMQEAEHPSTPEAAYVLRAFVQRTGPLCREIRRHYAQPRARFFLHPEICISGEMRALYIQATLTFEELFLQQPSAFILRE